MRGAVVLVRVVARAVADVGFCLIGGQWGVRNGEGQERTFGKSLEGALAGSAGGELGRDALVLKVATEGA